MSTTREDGLKDLEYFKQKLVKLTLAEATDEDILAVRNQIELLKESLDIYEEIADE